MSSPAPAPRRLWQLAGALALAHIVLMLAGFTMTPVSRPGDSPTAAVAAYQGSSAAVASIGTAISTLGFLALLCAVPLLAQLLRGKSETGRWLAGIIAGSGVLYVGLTLALPCAASAAARYGAQHGMPADVVLAVSNLHWFGVYLTTVLLGAFTLAIGIAVWRTRALPRWFAVAGFVAGACCLVTSVMPPTGVVDDVTLIWMIWFVLLAVTALRAGRRSRRTLAVPVAA